MKRLTVALVALLALTACSPATLPTGTNDPGEAANRQVHAFNKGLDRYVLRPTATGYGTVVPEPVRGSISNVSGNLSLPGKVVNDLLQLQIEDAGHNAFRFALNTTLGVGGLFDPAGSSFGLPERDTDFGETLHVWGVGEGAYVELPVFGPSTVRDAVGTAVDIAGNPVGYFLQSPEDLISPTTRVAELLDTRYRFAGTVDSILYESADSYVQLRDSYLDRRRFQLGGATSSPELSEPEYFDPYEDLYAE